MFLSTCSHHHFVPAFSPSQHSELPVAPSLLYLGVPLAVCSEELLPQMPHTEPQQSLSHAAQTYKTHMHVFTSVLVRTFSSIYCWQPKTQVFKLKGGPRCRATESLQVGQG